MKRFSIIALALSLFLVSCNGQTEKDENKTKKDTIKPSENIKVNKEYDEEGNLVRYDSTYTSFYSNIENDTIRADSIFSSFMDIFNNSYPFSNKFYFNQLFFQDSLLKYDFYKDDFFMNRYRNNLFKMDKLFEDMDSLKNDFYNQQKKKE